MSKIEIELGELYRSSVGSFGIYSYYSEKEQKPKPKLVSLKTIYKRVEKRNNQK